MELEAAARLIDAWDPTAEGTVHRRLAVLVTALRGVDGDIDRDTLGARNRRLLALHRELVGSGLDARVTCTSCGVESEFEVPVQSILDLPPPDPTARVAVRLGRRTVHFRLPTMADLDELADLAGPAELRRRIVERCRLERAGEPVSDLVAARIGQQFEALDPAANIVVNIACPGCAAPLAVSVDIAAFVAQAIERLVDGLLADIDSIATAYGWDEGRILALPAWRRRHYVDLIHRATPASRAAVRPSFGMLTG